MRRILRLALSAVFLPIRELGIRALIIMSRGHAVRGVEVRDLTGNAPGRVFDQIDTALAVIETVSPIRFRQLQRTLPQILLTSATGTAYWPTLRACMMRVSTAEARSISDLALLLVHEATHARVDRMGIRVTPANRSRVEELCMRVQAQLAAELPDSAAQLARIEAQLTDRWWEPSQRLERRLNELKAMGCPKWLIRSLRWVLDE